MDTKLMNTPVTNFEALVGQARDCGLTQTFATAYEVNKALDEADCCGGGGSTELDLSGKTTFGYMFSGCKNLVEVPKMITSDGTNFNSMFANCSNLTTIPQLDTSNGTNFGSMFQLCSKLTTIPQLDTSSGTNFGSMFYNCYNLTTIPQLDISKGTDFSHMFHNCYNLITIPQLDISNGTNNSYMFSGCNKLENITFVGSINRNIDFSPCTLLTYESVKSILTACSNTTNTNSKTAYFKITLTDQNSELTDLIATCTSKGWTITGLTLN